MFSFAPFHRLFFVIGVFVTWFAFVDTVAGKEALREQDRRLQDRLLERAGIYLNSIPPNTSPIEPYAMVVRGLLHAGFSPDHPFLRATIDRLSQFVPQDRHGMARQREVAMLTIGLRAFLRNHPENRTDLPARFFPSQRDASRIRSALISDHYNENYRRFGVICLPNGFDSNRHPLVPAPLHTRANQAAVVSFPPVSCRYSDNMETSGTMALCVFFPGKDLFFHASLAVPTGYVQIAQTVRLRN